MQKTDEPRGSESGLAGKATAETWTAESWTAERANPRPARSWSHCVGPTLARHDRGNDHEAGTATLGASYASEDKFAAADQLQLTDYIYEQEI